MEIKGKQVFCNLLIFIRFVSLNFLWYIGFVSAFGTPPPLLID